MKYAYKLLPEAPWGEMRFNGSVISKKQETVLPFPIPTDIWRTYRKFMVLRRIEDTPVVEPVLEVEVVTTPSANSDPAVLVETSLLNTTKANLLAILKEKGYDTETLKGLTKSELATMIEGDTND